MVGLATYNAAMDAMAKIDVSALRIVKYPDPVLREGCAEVKSFDGDLQRLAERMFEIMYAGRGLGLAAPQVGLPVRLFVFNPDGAPGPGEGVCINPRIVHQDGNLLADEGCLSLPEVSCRLKRYKSVTLRALDLRGEPRDLHADGLLARAFQHEIDHLNGVLIIDRMSAVAKLANRRVIKELEEQYRAGEP